MKKQTEKKKKKMFSERDECAGKRRIRRVKAWQVNDVFLNRNVAALNRHVAPNGRLPSGPEAGLASANQITNILINSASGVKHAAEMRDACFLLFFFSILPSFLIVFFFFSLPAAERDSDSKEPIPLQQQFHNQKHLHRKRSQRDGEESFFSSDVCGISSPPSSSSTSFFIFYFFLSSAAEH